MAFSRFIVGCGATVRHAFGGEKHALIFQVPQFLLEF